MITYPVMVVADATVILQSPMSGFWTRNTVQYAKNKKPDRLPLYPLHPFQAQFFNAKNLYIFGTVHVSLKARQD